MAVSIVAPVPTAGRIGCQTVPCSLSRPAAGQRDFALWQKRKLTGLGGCVNNPLGG